MKEVYFDTNVYSHIYNLHHGITRDDREKLFSCIRSDKLRVYLSGVVLEETISALLSREKEALNRLRLIHRISKRKRILKEYRQVLDEVIEAYAKDQRSSSFFMSPPPFLKWVLRNQSKATLKGLRELATESQQQIQERKKSTEELFKKIWPLAKEEKEQGEHQTFEEYFKEHSENVVEIFANLAGLLPECQKKGINGLLNLTPLRGITIAILSQGYANTYEKAAINRGDSRDLHHAIYASMVGTLVTHDKGFSNVMKRSPIDRLEVVDLHALLAKC